MKYALVILLDCGMLICLMLSSLMLGAWTVAVGGPQLLAQAKLAGLPGCLLFMAVGFLLWLTRLYLPELMMVVRRNNNV